MNVILDYGHGGLTSDGVYTTAPSKMHRFNDGVIAYEGVLNRQIGRQVERCLLDHHNINIIRTVAHNDPTDLPLADRVRIANQYDPSSTIFVSIHCNASPSHTARGFEIFTTVGETKSDILAECISQSVSYSLDKYNVRFRKDTSDGDSDKESNFYVLRNTKCPAVLLECGFFDNRFDYELLSDPLFQADLGSFIYTGIMNYIYQQS
jgi:N-acetylmuramoyl-L-alanine amidase